MRRYQQYCFTVHLNKARELCRWVILLIFLNVLRRAAATVACRLFNSLSLSLARSLAREIHSDLWHAISFNYNLIFGWEQTRVENCRKLYAVVGAGMWTMIMWSITACPRQHMDEQNDRAQTYFATRSNTKPDVLTWEKWAYVLCRGAANPFVIIFWVRSVRGQAYHFTIFVMRICYASSPSICWHKLSLQCTRYCVLVHIASERRKNCTY